MKAAEIHADLTTIYQRLFESAAEALVVANENGEVVLSNPRAVEMFGYTSEELKGLKVEALMPPTFRGGHKAHRDSYHARPSPRSMGEGMTLQGIKKDGTIFPVEISLNHVEVGDQKYAMALITDITQRSKAQEEVLKLNSELEFRVNERTAQLAESQYLYSAIARNYPNGTINVFDKHFDYIFTEGKELFKMGITSEHLIGTNYLDRLSGEVKDEITTYLESALKGVNDELEIELRGEHYLLNFVGLKGNDEKIDKILVVEQNISRQKQAEKEIMQALQQEKDLNELKSRFVSTASHEFRTPLSTILSSASILERYLKAEEMDPAEVEARQIKHLKKISTSVTNLTNILNDFLSIDKLESGLKSNATVFNLSELMEEIIEEIKEVLKPSQEIIFSNDCDAEITQDRNIIKNIVINLLSNASKYSDPGARIDLITACNNRSVQVSVVDQGMGIPEEEHKHLFTRFFRASNATNHGGTGLGLHIVKKYTEMLSGNIHFTSEQGKGSRFVVSLPKSARP